MTTDRGLDRELERLARQFKPPASVVNDVMRRIAEEASSANDQSVARPDPDVPSEPADGVSREIRPITTPPGRRHTWRLIAMMQRRSMRWLSAAAAVLVVLGGWSLVSRSPKPGGSATDWWLAPPSVWAAEINAALATIKGVTCREQTQIVDADGSAHLSSTWHRFYVSRDSYRRDIYDGDYFREIQWYTPDGGDMLQTSVRFDTKSYCVLRHHGRFGDQDPIERIRFYVALLDKADRQLGRTSIDGHECVGFEIRASKYGSNPDAYLDRIWFDVKTRLPVRIELAGRPVTSDKVDTVLTFTFIQDQFDYSPVLPEDTFTPNIPSGLINAHPDELRKPQSSPGQ